jgi:hypothetical protein
MSLNEIVDKLKQLRDLLMLKALEALLMSYNDLLGYALDSRYPNILWSGKGLHLIILKTFNS